MMLDVVETSRNKNGIKLTCVSFCVKKTFIKQECNVTATITIIVISKTKT